ncbi:MAG: hypothetical protein WAM43_14425 [Terriglobales bacterium]
MPKGIGQLWRQEVSSAGLKIGSSKITGEIVEVDPVARKWEALLK